MLARKGVHLLIEQLTIPRVIQGLRFTAVLFLLLYQQKQNNLIIYIYIYIYNMLNHELPRLHVCGKYGLDHDIRRRVL